MQTQSTRATSPHALTPVGWARAAFEGGQSAAQGGMSKADDPYTRVSYKHHGPQKSAWWRAGFDSVAKP